MKPSHVLFASQPRHLTLRKPRGIFRNLFGQLLFLKKTVKIRYDFSISDAFHWSPVAKPASQERLYLGNQSPIQHVFRPLQDLCTKVFALSKKRDLTGFEDLRL